MRNPLTLLKGSFSLVQGNVALFFGILLVPMLLSVVVGLFTPAKATGVINLADWSTYLVLLIIAGIFNVLMSVALILAIDNRSLTVIEAYKNALPMFVRYTLFSLLMSLIVMISFILFIIPGIIVSVWLTFASFALILEKAPIVASLKRSREYVRGRWWGVFYRLIVIVLFAIAMSIVATLIGKLVSLEVLSKIVEVIISVAITPIALAYIYLMYQDVKGSPSVSTTASTSPTTPPATASPTV